MLELGNVELAWPYFGRSRQKSQMSSLPYLRRLSLWSGLRRSHRLKVHCNPCTATESK